MKSRIFLLCSIVSLLLAVSLEASAMGKKKPAPSPSPTPSPCPTATPTPAPSPSVPEKTGQALVQAIWGGNCQLLTRWKEKGEDLTSAQLDLSQYFRGGDWNPTYRLVLTGYVTPVALAAIRRALTGDSPSLDCLLQLGADPDTLSRFVDTGTLVHQTSFESVLLASPLLKDPKMRPHMVRDEASWTTIEDALLLLARTMDVDFQSYAGLSPVLHVVHAMRTEDAHLSRLLDALLERHPNLNLQSEWGKTALHYACDPTVVTKLLDAGADPSVQDNDSKTPLLVWLQTSGCQVAFKTPLMLRAIRQARLEILGPVFVAAANSGRFELADAVLARGISVDSRDQKGSTALILAATEGAQSRIEYLLARHATPDARDASGHTALMLAAKKAAYLPVTTLLNGRASPTPKNRDGRTALFFGIEGGSAAVVLELLNRGACVNIIDQQGTTPLALAIQSQKADIVEILRAHLAENPNGC